MIKVFVINGYPSSGKDTFVEYCDEVKRSVSVITSNPAKAALRVLGWNGESKTPEERAAMAELKQIGNKLYDTTMKFVAEKLKEIDAYTAGDCLVFVHSREAEEIAELVKKYNAPTILISRGEAVGNFSNSSDNNVMKYPAYDHVIFNNGSLERLREYAHEFVKVYGGSENESN